MRTTPRTDDILAKRAILFDEMAARANVRRARALKNGNQREADGAKLTAEDAHASARRLRAQIGRPKATAARTF